jgi:hypothetical protein
MTAAELRHHLQDLCAERALALTEGLDAVPAYMADLDGEIAAVNAAFVGAAVTEIASLRAQLSGRLEG